ncbi:MAG TPA: hypothetical protein VGF67_13485 [Ktedonobacteraceae bacterium]|jgi:uncharacterized protein YutE (UPF0331/DUF86 family)
MQDKSFVQAMHEKVSSHIEEAMQRMLLDRTTATRATTAIRDESMRAVVTSELITGQLIALLALLKEGGVIDETQYSEFSAHLRQALIHQYNNVIARHTP